MGTPEGVANGEPMWIATTNSDLNVEEKKGERRRERTKDGRACDGL